MINEIRLLNSVILKDYIFRKTNEKYDLSKFKTKKDYLYYVEENGNFKIKFDSLKKHFNFDEKELKKLLINLKKSEYKNVKNIELNNNNIILLFDSNEIKKIKIDDFVKEIY